MDLAIVSHYKNNSARSQMRTPLRSSASKGHAIGKLYNIVYYITRSDKRRRTFEAV
jgi:hypothetical protein